MNREKKSKVFEKSSSKNSKSRKKRSSSLSNISFQSSRSDVTDKSNHYRRTSTSTSSSDLKSLTNNSSTGYESGFSTPSGRSPSRNEVETPITRFVNRLDRHTPNGDRRSKSTPSENSLRYSRHSIPNTSSSKDSQESTNSARYFSARSGSLSTLTNRRSRESIESTSRRSLSRSKSFFSSLSSQRSPSRNEVETPITRFINRLDRHTPNGESNGNTPTPTPFENVSQYSNRSSSKKEKSKNPTPLSTADSRRSSPTRSESRSPKPSKNALNRRFSLVSLNPEGAQSSGSTSASRSSRDSSDFLSRYSYIILRKIYKNGKWYEERQETIYTMRTDGKPSTRSSVSQSELNMTETPEYSEYLSKIDPNFLGIERAIKAFPKGGRGIFQDDQEEFGKEILAKINEYRQKHEGKNIKLNKNLSVYAREWANYLARNSKIGFSNRHDVGEAIFARTTSEPWTKISGDDVVEKWYSEIETHDFENPHEIKAANFTQLVWRSTKEIGVALERSQDGLISYVVVFFHPKGNFPGDVTKQVIGVGDNLNKLKNKKGVMEPQAVDKTESFHSAVLRAANYYRLLHGVLPLVLDNALSIYAQEWADQLALEDKIRPRPNNVYGENLYLSSFKINSDLHGQEPVEYWYGTKKYHSHFKEPADIRAAPFTQLIWGASRDIGVGFAKSKTDRTYVAAYFNPPGNLVGQFGKEVLPMKWNMP